MGIHRRNPEMPGDLPGPMPPEAPSSSPGALPPEIPGWHDETVTMPAIEQEAYSFPAPLAVNEQSGYEPALDSVTDRCIDGLRRYLRRGVVVATAGTLVLAAALLLEQSRQSDNTEDNRASASQDPTPSATAKASATTYAPTSPPPPATTFSALPNNAAAKRSAKPSPSRTKASLSPSASASASVTNSASPSSSTTPEYTCNTGPELVVCKPAEDQGAMSTYPYPDATRPAEYVLSPGQEFVAECKLVSPADGRRWVLGLDGTYALQGIFGGNLSNVPDCDMN